MRSSFLCEANPRVHRKLERAGLLAKLGADSYFATLAQSLGSRTPPQAGPASAAADTEGRP